jgi:hypothetical protein
LNCFLCNKPVEHSEESAFLGRYAHKECFLDSMSKQRDAILEVQKLEKERIKGGPDDV